MTRCGGHGPPVCSRCGTPQPPAGPLQTSDGTPVSPATYLALAGLVGDALVCPACVASCDQEDGEPGDSPRDCRRGAG